MKFRTFKQSISTNMDKLQAKIEKTINSELENIAAMLTKKCNETIQQVFSTFSAEIIAKCGIEATTLQEIWTDTCMNTPLALNIKKNPVNPQSDSTKQSQTCIAILQRGKNAGSPCGVRTKNGSSHCARHSHLSEQAPEPKTATKKSTNPSDKPTGPILRYNPTIKHFVHPETGIVLDSDRSTIIGKYVDNEIRQLSKTDFKNAVENYGFKINADSSPAHLEKTSPNNQPTTDDPKTKSKAKPAKKSKSNEEEETEKKEAVEADEEEEAEKEEEEAEKEEEEEAEEAEEEEEEEEEAEEEEEEAEEEEEEEEEEEVPVVQIVKRRIKPTDEKSKSKSKSRASSRGTTKQTKEVKEILAAFGH